MSGLFTQEINEGHNAKNPIIGEAFGMRSNVGTRLVWYRSMAGLSTLRIAMANTIRCGWVGTSSSACPQICPSSAMVATP